MDLAYAGLGEGVHGLGVHRGALFTALRGAARAGGRGAAARRRGRRRRRDRTLIDAGGARYGPYDLDRRRRRRALDDAPLPRRVRARIHEHRWGALWGVFADPDGTFDGRLDQYFDGARRMVGFLPDGVERGLGVLVGAAGPDRGRARRGRRRVPRRPAVAGAGGRAVIAGLRSMDQLLPASYRQVSLPRWHDGTLVLLGDAAHALSPQLGQGANLALMDAAALADAPRSTPSRRRGARQARFYGFGARALNMVFQNDLDALRRGRATI